MTASDVLTSIVATATRAPSMHNTQPWRFRAYADDGVRGSVVEVWSDPARRLPAADPTGWATRIACGAAALGVRLGIATQGYQPLWQVLPEGASTDPEAPELIARVTVGPSRLATPQEQALHRAIRRRRSNRYPFSDTPPSPDAPGALLAAAHAEQAWLDVLDSPRRRAAVAAVVREAEHRLRADPAYRAELARWIRDGPTGDGMPREAGGPSPAQHDLLALRDFGAGPRPPQRDFEPNPLVCVLGADSDDRAAQVHAGMALYRVLLTATSIGLASSMLSQPIELPALRRDLRSALGRSVGWPHMVLRFGYGVRSPATPRRPVTEVLDTIPSTSV